MTAKHLQQPKRSKSCGQHCVAMLAGVDVATVIRKCGSGSTTAAQILVIANQFGLKQKTKLWQLPREGQAFPVFGIIKLRKPRRKSFHWACVVDGVIHDPAYSVAGVQATGHHVACWIEFNK